MKKGQTNKRTWFNIYNIKNKNICIYYSSLVEDHMRIQWIITISITITIINANNKITLHYNVTFGFRNIEQPTMMRMSAPYGALSVSICIDAIFLRSFSIRQWLIKKKAKIRNSTTLKRILYEKFCLLKWVDGCTIQPHIILKNVYTKDIVIHICYYFHSNVYSQKKQKLTI